MRDNLKTWQIVLYGMGNQSYTVLFGMTAWIMYGYCPPEGKGIALVSLGAFSLISVLGRVLEALLNPFVGILSDNASTRWGRRVPFILLGGFFVAVASFFISRPPVTWGPDPLNAAYFTFFYILLTISGLVMFQPMLALIPEITASSGERVKLASVGLLMAAVLSVISLLQGPIFEKYGFSNMTMIFGILVFLLALGPVAAIREKRDVIRFDKAVSQEIRFGKALKDIMKNRIFVVFTIADSVQMLSLITVTTAMPYLLTEVAGKRLTDSATAGLFIIMGLLAGIPLANFATRRFCKKLVFAGSTLANTVLLGLMTLLLLAPRHLVFPLLAVFVFFYAMSFAFTMTVRNPMLADVILLDNRLTGDRKEAMYIGMHGMIFRIIDSTNVGITGLLFHTFGYSAESSLGIYLVFPVCAILSLTSYLLIRDYPMDDRGKFLPGYAIRYPAIAEKLEDDFVESGINRD